jgi:phosphoglycolate phosphatase
VDTVSIIQHYFGDHPFVAVQGHVPGVPLKPDPASALAMARTLGLSPARILYLGDSDIDMFTARAACMYAVGAAWGFRGADELRAGGADRVCATPLEVATLLPPPPSPGVA